MFCIFPSGSPCPPSRVESYTPSVLISCIHLLCDWWFCLDHYNICYFVVSYLFSLRYDWFLWRCSRYLIFFHWILSGSRYPQVSRTLLSIVDDLSNVIVWMVSHHPLTSKSFSPSSNPLVTLPSSSVAIGITVTYMFHIFFPFSSKVQVLLSFSLSSSFSLWSSETAKSTIRLILFCCLYSLGLVVWPTWSDPFISQNAIISHRLSVCNLLTYLKMFI